MDQEQYPVRITMDKTRDRTLLLFSQRIIPFPRPLDKFMHGRYHCTPQGMTGIIRGKQTQVIGCNSHWQFRI
jgi:hypothetical protein